MKNCFQLGCHIFSLKQKEHIFSAEFKAQTLRELLINSEKQVSKWVGQLTSTGKVFYPTDENDSIEKYKQKSLNNIATLSAEFRELTMFAALEGGDQLENVVAWEKIPDPVISSNLFTLVDKEIIKMIEREKNIDSFPI